MAIPPPRRRPYTLDARTPRVSVLVPVRDAAATVGDALASVLGQTLADLEVVVVDDGSTDATPAILAAAAADPRVRVLSRPARGIVAALDDGLEACRAPLVARMDADDVCLPGRLAAQVDLLDARPDLTAVACLVRCFPEDGLTDGMRAYEAWLNGLVEPEAIGREMYVESPLPHPAVVIRRAALEAMGGWRDGPFPEDYDLWLRLDATGARFAKVPRVLLLWRDGGRRLSRTDPRYSPDAFLACKADHLVEGLLAGRTAVQGCGAGRDAKAWGRALAARGVRVARWFEVDPRKIGQTVAGAPVLPWPPRPEHRDLPLLAAVGRPEARARIRADLEASGWEEGREWVIVQ